MPTHTHTHTQSHTQTLKKKGILSEVDPYQVLCQSPGAMRYLVPRICLNTLASLFGSTDSQTQPSTERRLFTYVVNCAALFLSGTQTEKKGELSWAECPVGRFHLLYMRLYSARDKRITEQNQQKRVEHLVNFPDSDVPLCPSDGHKNKECEMLNVSRGRTWSGARDNYWHAYLTVYYPCSLPFRRPSCFKKKKKTASMLPLQVASLLHNDIGLLTPNIYDFGKGKWSLHLSYCEVQHEPKGMRGEFRHTADWDGKDEFRVGIWSWVALDL